MNEDILYIQTPNGEIYGVGPTKISQLQNDSNFISLPQGGKNGQILAFDEQKKIKWIFPSELEDTLPDGDEVAY